MNQTALGEKILNHWRQNRPQMVSDLEKSNRLQQAVLEAQEATSDLLYDLIAVKKMEYDQAWELATRNGAFLPAEARSRRKSSTKSGFPKSSRSRKKRRALRRGTSG